MTTRKSDRQGFSADEACGKRPIMTSATQGRPAIKLEPLNETLAQIVITKNGHVDKQATHAAREEAANRILDSERGLRARYRFSYVSGLIEERILPRDEVTG